MIVYIFDLLHISSIIIIIIFLQDQIFVSIFTTTFTMTFEDNWVSSQTHTLYRQFIILDSFNQVKDLCLYIPTEVKLLPAILITRWCRKTYNFGVPRALFQTHKSYIFK